MMESPQKEKTIFRLGCPTVHSEPFQIEMDHPSHHLSLRLCFGERKQYSHHFAIFHHEPFFDDRSTSMPHFSIEVKGARGMGFAACGVHATTRISEPQIHQLAEPRQTALNVASELGFTERSQPLPPSC
jgi:hypothetical protein